MTKYKCDKCNKPATVHYQNCEIKWNIIDGIIDINNPEFLSGTESEYYCKKHA